MARSAPRQPPAEYKRNVAREAGTRAPWLEADGFAHPVFTLIEG
jgi:hypothetical protein